MQKRNIEYQLKREIELAWLDRESASLLMRQAKYHVESLKKQKNIEQQKFHQARAEEIAIVRYDLEIIGAQTGYIDALERLRVAEAKLRLLTHSYK